MKGLRGREIERVKLRRNRAVELRIVLFVGGQEDSVLVIPGHTF